MKRIFTLSFALILALSLQAQQRSAEQISQDYFKEMSSDWQLSQADYQEAYVRDMYTSKHNGVTHVYYNQAHKGIPVYNAITNFNISKEGKVLHAGNNFVSDLASKITSTTASISAVEALQSVAAQLEITDRSAPTIKEKVDEHHLVFNKTSYSHNDIPASLSYVVTKNGDVRLAWDFAIDMKDNADYWSLRADAVTGEIISQHNWTVYCNHDHKRGGIKKHENCGAHAHAKQVNKTTAVSGSYNVYPFPAESPLEVEQTMVSQPHYPAASPLGWHDTDGMDGAEYTITRGNNVHAYLDTEDTNVPDLGSEPEGGEELVFDFPHDTDNAADMSQDAAVTNLFYANNIMHDLIYLAGFDEAAGNFQQNNYGNGGVGGDYVLAEAQDASGTDNANFATPGDGGNGRMQMFLWTNNGGNLTINSPAEIEGIVSLTGTADFGLAIEAADVTANAAIARNSGSNPTNACTEVLNGEEINGKIALVDRGECFFFEKVLNAQNAGAVAALVCNVPGINGGTGDEISGMTAPDDDPSAAQVTIPSLFVQYSVCQTIKASINAGVDVELTMKQVEPVGPPMWDASYDNGVIAHEFGHGISNRLTGGPTAAGCLGNDEQMGEGWSDFFTLVTTAKVGDSGTSPRGIGNYVDSQGTNGRGIRSQPYSTDFNVNNKTYADIIGTTAPHPLGEVWVATLWDIYWAFVDLYGFDEDWSNTESGNFKAIQLVMDGMKFQQCSPGFVEGRDAIFGADVANNEGIHECLLWDIFARRGYGFFADGGSTDDRNDGTENFEPKPQCIAELKISKEVTEVVQSQNNIDVTLTVTNHFPETVNNVEVRDQIPAGSEYVAGSGSITGTVDGTEVVFSIPSIDFDDEVVISYELIATSGKSTTIFLNDVESDEDFDFWNIDVEGTSSLWLPDNSNPYSGGQHWFCASAEADVDQRLIFGPFTVSGNVPTFRFWHNYNTQNGNDGGFVEITTDGGSIWSRFPDKFIRNGYPAPLSYSAVPIPSNFGFSGSSDGYIDSYIDLSDYTGQEVSVRFRYGSDETVIATGANPGWAVDAVELMDLIMLESSATVTSDEASATSNTARTIIDSDQSVEVVDAAPDFFNMSVFPNPASDEVHISIATKDRVNGSISLNAIDGRLIMQDNISLDQTTRVKTLDIKSLTSGVYFIKIATELGTITEKLTIK